MEKDLNFKPMTEGLGFHPFSDGLPYAPLSRSPSGNSANSSNQTAAKVNRLAGADAELASARARELLGSGAAGPVAPQRPGAASSAARQSQGAGATAAGLPRFSPQLPVKVAPPRAKALTAASPALSAPSFGAGATFAGGATFVRPAVPGARVTPSMQTHTPAAEPEYVTQTEFGFLYLIKRMIAYGLDSALNIALCLGALAVVGSRQGVKLDMLSNPSMAVLAIAFLLMFNWAMIAGEEVIFKTTFGKRLFGLHLRGSASALFLRAFFFLPSMGFSGLGVMWALFDGRRRCWHDHVVDVQPEET